jgi:hypothetical protein
MPLLVLPVGLLVGLLLGALGGGGSILAVPALVFLLGEDPQQATTGSLVVVGVTALVALVPHARRGHVRIGQGLVFGALGTAGSFIGTMGSALVPEAVLLIAFAALMGVVAFLMVRRSRGPTLAAGGPARGGDGPAGAGETYAAGPRLLSLRPFSCDWPRLAKVLVAATAVGLLTGFFGVGGGFLVVPALVLGLSFPMPVAVGTSLLVIAVNSATALAARAGADVHLDWLLIAGFTAAAVAGALVGGRLATKLPGRHLSRAFAALLGVLAVWVAGQGVTALV